jgi:predicted nucleic acid-binding protein
LSYLVDTNVLSELRSRRADIKVVAWMSARPRQSLYLSVLSLGEIRKGIEGVAEPAFRQTLMDWLEVELPNYFVGRLLGIDAQIADRWGRVQAGAGRTLPVIDGLLAATALQHDLTLVTRNSKDFAGLGLRLVNPWTAPLPD